MQNTACRPLNRLPDPPKEGAIGLGRRVFRSSPPSTPSRGRLMTTRLC